jgi:predicted Rossmann fold nucleotide-binding protein DprA/Smf involved in DNA uptake
MAAARNIMVTRLRLNEERERMAEAMASAREAVEEMGGEDPLGLLVYPEDAQRAARGSVREQVLAQLPASVKSIVNTTGLENAQVANSLQNMKRRGEVERDGRVWKLVEEAETA